VQHASVVRSPIPEADDPDSSHSGVL
jgi:hypothetical protein